MNGHEKIRTRVSALAGRARGRRMRSAVPFFHLLDRQNIAIAIEHFFEKIKRKLTALC